MDNGSPAGTTPTGSVTFYDAGVAVGTGTLTMTSAGKATATLTTASLAAGGHSFTAVYGGDATFAAGSPSAPFAHTVNPAATKTTISSSALNVGYNQSVTFTAVVSPTAANAGSPPSGSVNFYDGSTLLGSGALVNGVATLTKSNLGVSGHQITAVYQGDGNYLTSTSPALTETVGQASVVPNLTANLGSATAYQPVSFTLTLGGASGLPAPTGTVTFVIDGNAQSAGAQRRVGDAVPAERPRRRQAHHRGVLQRGLQLRGLQQLGQPAGRDHRVQPRLSESIDARVRHETPDARPQGRASGVFRVGRASGAGRAGPAREARPSPSGHADSPARPAKKVHSAPRPGR